MLFLLNLVKQPGAQHRQGLRLVLVLRLFILADNNQTGWKMCYSYRGIGCIDTLTTGAGRTINIYFEFVHININFDLICLGQDRGWTPDERPGDSRSASAGAPRPLTGTVDIVAGRGRFYEGTAPDPDAPEPPDTQPRLCPL